VAAIATVLGELAESSLCTEKDARDNGSTSVRISSAPLNLYYFSSMLLQGVTGHDQSPVA
jgi:hypothetical protein